uniref:Rho-GAP domain-containing protein n=1 Tax=Acrobeloides nanus TaxID=290746 RepID=A0A914CJ05_9BILA
MVASTSKQQSGSLKDFCSNKNHMIPSLLVNCVNALDKNRLDFQGIYRINGQGSLIQKLLKELKGSKEIVNLDMILKYDTETITGCIKAFLKEIRDPLIPPYLFEDFYQACDSELDFKIHDAILKLPKPHQDTLIYMFGHWNRVVINSEKNLMPLENLAKCLAPTVVGIYMEKDIKIDAAGEGIEKQIKIMKRLLSMPQKYWQIENSQEGMKSFQNSVFYI